MSPESKQSSPKQYCHPPFLFSSLEKVTNSMEQRVDSMNGKKTDCLRIEIQNELRNPELLLLPPSYVV